MDVGRTVPVEVYSILLERSELNIKGKKIVVIGGAGLIGSHTVDLLTHEDVGEIVVFDNFTRGTPKNLEKALIDPRVRLFSPNGDILYTDVLAEALDGADGVFHFAALWLLHCQEYPRAAFDVNIQGTFNVIEACIAKGVKRLVYSSSASVYGDAETEPMTEDHPFNNENFYGATKIAGEAMMRALHHRFGLPYVGLRYMNVYGPRQDYNGAYVAVMMKMLDKLDKGEPLQVYGDGSQAYDFVFVDDCARANILAMQADAADRFYNVGTGIRTSILELAKLLQELTGKDTGIEFLPEGQTFVKNRIGATELASKEIGYDAQTALRDGLMALIEWRRHDKAANATEY